MKHIDETFAPRFAKLLETKNVTPQQLSAETIIPLYSIQQWLKGKSVPKCKYLYALYDYFNVSMDYLCGLKDERGKKLY